MVASVGGLNPRLLSYESNALTTRPLLRNSLKLFWFAQIFVYFQGNFIALALFKSIQYIYGAKVQTQVLVVVNCLP